MIVRASGVELNVTINVEQVVAIERVAVGLTATPLSFGVALCRVPLDYVGRRVGVGGFPFSLRKGRCKHRAQRGQYSLARTDFCTDHRTSSSSGASGKNLLLCDGEWVERNQIVAGAFPLEHFLMKFVEINSLRHLLGSFSMLPLKFQTTPRCFAEPGTIASGDDHAPDRYSIGQTR
jgi:hypothetical protein